MIIRPLLVLVVSFAVISCNQQPTDVAENERSGRPGAAPSSPFADLATPDGGSQAPDTPMSSVAREAQDPIFRVNSLRVRRTPELPQRITIHATGVSREQGWENPALILAEDTAFNQNARVWIYNFVADAPPELSSGSEVIRGELVIEALPDHVTQIRVVAASNDLVANLSPYSSLPN